MLILSLEKKRKKHHHIHRRPLLLYVVTNYSPPPFLRPPCNSIFPWNQRDRPGQASEAQIMPDRNSACWDGRMQRCSDTVHNKFTDMDQQLVVRWKKMQEWFPAHRLTSAVKKTQSWPSWSLAVVCLFVWVLVCTCMQNLASTAQSSSVHLCFFRCLLLQSTTVNWAGGWGVSGSCLNAHIINVKGHTHSVSLSLWSRSPGLMRGGVWQCAMKANWVAP